MRVCTCSAFDDTLSGITRPPRWEHTKHFELKRKRERERGEKKKSSYCKWWTRTCARVRFTRWYILYVCILLAMTAFCGGIRMQMQPVIVVVFVVFVAVSASVSVISWNPSTNELNVLFQLNYYYYCRVPSHHITSQPYSRESILRVEQFVGCNFWYMHDMMHNTSCIVHVSWEW